MYFRCYSNVDLRPAELYQIRFPLVLSIMIEGGVDWTRFVNELSMTYMITGHSRMGYIGSGCCSYGCLLRTLSITDVGLD